MLETMRSRSAWPSGLACVHHLETDACLIRSREIAPAFGNHGRRDVGQHEASFRVARKQMAAEQARAAAQLEHVRLLTLGQEARQPVGDRALKPGMTLVAFRASAEACGDFGATTGEHWRIRGHDARTSRGCLRGRTWPPSCDQMMPVSSQIASLIEAGTMASSRAARARTGQASSCFSLPRVPMHQPIEPFVEPRDIERFR